MTLRIRHKVFLPALAIIVSLLAPAAYSVRAIVEINRHARDLSLYSLPGTASARDMRLALQQMILFAKLAANSLERGEYLRQLTQERGRIDAEMTRLTGREAEGPRRSHLRFQEAVEVLHAAARTGTLEEVDGAAKTARESLDRIEHHFARRVEEGVAEVARIANVAAGFTLWALGAGLLVSAVVWVAILVSLGRPLRELVAGTDRIAAGTFDEPIPVLSRDELGTLSDAFNRMAASLGELDRMKAEIVATASHELRTPLACIKGFASLLLSGRRGPLTEAQRTTLAQVETQVDQMTRFVNQLLDLSRLRAGRVAMKLRSLPTEAFLSSAARGFEGVAEKRDIRYQVRLTPGLPSHIRADPDRIGEVVYNLLGNAFKFTGTGGEVLFEAEADAGWLKVAVSDTGPGIPQEDLPFIFEKYFRGTDGSDARGNEGAGLGLAISRGIVEKHGGRIWVERREVRGSRFVFRIPAGGAVSGDAPGTRPESAAAESRGASR